LVSLSFRHVANEEHLEKTIEMKRKYFGAIGIGVLSPLSLQAAAQPAQEKERPNIILIMSDDMGYSDLGCYGSEINTPNLDALAKNGLRFTQFYNQGRSCPTRASLMTGLYPHQAGIGWMTAVSHDEDGYKGELNSNCVTIAQVLKESGYSTYMSGKWHLQYDKHTVLNSPNHNWPLQRGFDKFYGMLVGAGNYYDPATLCRNNTLITPYTDSEYKPDNYYFTDAITDNALAYLHEDRGDKPFFIYVAYTTAHWPMHAPEEAIAKYLGKYDKGWDYTRHQRLTRMQELGVIDTTVAMSPATAGSWADEPDKLPMARRMETYAAMIEIMDQGIGRLIAELKRKGILEKTIILFLQDNGGCAEGIGFGGPEGQTRPIANDTTDLKPLTREGLQTQVIPPVTREGQIVMAGKKVMAGPEDTYLAYLKPWAMVSNTPFRKYKKYVHEGGIATPLIIHWPSGIQSTGELRHQVGNVIDIMPTIIELAGVEYPQSYKGHHIIPLAGISLVTAFNNQPLNRKLLFWEHEMNRAVRMGNWKLVSTGKLMDGGYGFWKSYQNGKWELYDLATDRSELKDLSGQYPDIVSMMSAYWEKWAAAAKVLPAPWKETSQAVRSIYVDLNQ